MKKTIALIIAALLTLGCLSACGSGNEVSAENSDRLKIVTTIFPEYDWVMNILGDNPANADVTALFDNGVDLHSFQPSVSDILKISTCDRFICVGGESDRWVNEALQDAVNRDMVVINLLDLMGDSVKEEEMTEGMQKETHEGEHEECEIEYDEHVWLSLKNAILLTENISEAICRLDPDNADYYKSNAAEYKNKLNSLDAEYQAAVSDASVNTLLFGDRFPFRYLADDYGLSYYAAFAGCSAETEAGFETITFLAQKVDELSLPAVMTIEGSDHHIASAIVRNTRAKNQQILTMDSMQSITTKDLKAGTSYLSVMEKNLYVLKDALN